LVLRSGVCGWGRCCFCGYGRAAGKTPTVPGLKKEFDEFFRDIGNADTVKVYGSGSFLDEKQVPAEARAYFIERCNAAGVKKIVVESRPEYVTESKLDEFSGLELTVAIGLETADDALLDRINKGFHVRDYEQAAGTIHACGGKVRTYLIVNLPNSKNADLEKSVEYALKHSDSIVLINLLPHGNTEVFRLWLRGEWNFLSREEFRKATEKWKNDPRIDLDEETFRFFPKFPENAREYLRGVGEEFLTHPHFEVWQDYLQRWYIPPKEKDALVFLPCSYKKPYSESETHKKILEVLRKTKTYPRIHQAMLSNAGVVPREFEGAYPFNRYDWDESLETEEIKKRYVEVTKERIKGYLEAHKEDYRTICCFLKYESESYQALEAACRELGLSFVNLLTKETYEKIKNEGKPLQTDAALMDLYDNLIKEG